MKHKLIPYELPAQSGGNEQTIDVTSSDLTAKFLCQGIPARNAKGEYAYIDSIDLWHRTQIDVGAGGALIAQELPRTLATFEVYSDILGALYKPNDVKGPVLGNLAAIISNKYKLPHLLGADLAASSTNNVRNLRHRIPIAHHCFVKGHQTALAAGVMHGARVEATLAASTALAAAVASSAAEATTAVRAVANVFFSPDPYLPQPWVYREYETPANQTQHIIRGLGTGAGIGNASKAPQKVALLAYLTDVLGLGGADGADEIQQIMSMDLGIPNIAPGSPWYAPSAFLYPFTSDVPAMKNWEETNLGNGWPYKPGADITAGPNDADAMCVPYFWPDPEGQEVSACETFGRDVQITQQYGTVPTAAGRWLALEQVSYGEEMEDIFRERMGLPEGWTAVPKTLREGAGPDDDASDADLVAYAQKIQGVPQKFRPPSRVEG